MDAPNNRFTDALAYFALQKSNELPTRVAQIVTVVDRDNLECTDLLMNADFAPKIR